MTSGESHNGLAWPLAFSHMHAFSHHHPRFARLWAEPEEKNQPQDVQSLVGKVETFPRSMSCCVPKREVKKDSTEEEMCKSLVHIYTAWLDRELTEAFSILQPNRVSKRGEDKSPWKLSNCTSTHGLMPFEQEINYLKWRVMVLIGFCCC